MNVKKYLAYKLKEDGYDGLWTDECGCLCEDLAPCGESPLCCGPEELAAWAEGRAPRGVTSESEAPDGHR